MSNRAFSCKSEGMLHVRVPAGSGPSVLTFLSPEKNNFVRSYRSCLARDRREGRGKRKGWADISLSMRTIWALQLLICMPDPVPLKILLATLKRHSPWNRRHCRGGVVALSGTSLWSFCFGTQFREKTKIKKAPLFYQVLQKIHTQKWKKKVKWKLVHISCVT